MTIKEFLDSLSSVASGNYIINIQNESDCWGLKPSFKVTVGDKTLMFPKEYRGTVLGDYLINLEKEYKSLKSVDVQKIGIWECLYNGKACEFYTRDGEDCKKVFESIFNTPYSDGVVTFKGFKEVDDFSL